SVPQIFRSAILLNSSSNSRRNPNISSNQFSGLESSFITSSSGGCLPEVSSLSVGSGGSRSIVRPERPTRRKRPGAYVRLRAFRCHNPKDQVGGGPYPLGSTLASEEETKANVRFSLPDSLCGSLSLLVFLATFVRQTGVSRK